MFERLRSVGKTLKSELKVYRLVLEDRRTPILAKIMLALAVGYLLLPFDLIPDFIPIFGHLDDAVIVPALVVVAVRMIPQEVLDEARLKANVGQT
ncbi:MAG: DUF1232 domain-containing protein [Nitrospirae bacterium]|nr:DUF1232 domain-containing protein [Nitrospirota bacterium]